MASVWCNRRHDAVVVHKLLPHSNNSHPDITAYECSPTDIIRNGGEWILPFIVAGGDEWVEHAAAVYPDFNELLAHVISLPRIIVVNAPVTGMITESMH